VHRCIVDKCVLFVCLKLAVCVWFDNFDNMCTDMCIAMLPVLENAQQTLLTAKQLETENYQLKAAIDQHESDAKRQGDAL